MKKIRVLQIIDSLNAGGAEVLAVNIANGLSEKNIESHLCATRKEGILKANIDKKVGYIYINRKKIIDIKALLILRNYIKKNKINIVHSHATSWFFAVCIKLIKPSLELVWHDHFGNSEFLNKRNKFPLNILSILFSKIIVVNSNLKKWAENNLNCKKVYFVNNFASLEDTIPKTELLGKEGKKIVHLAGFREQKDHLNLLMAFELFIKKNSDWTLHLIGKDYDDVYSSKIKEYISSKSLERHVFLYGACMDIKNILSQATVGVLSSKSEGLPVSLLEYGLIKLPVVVTNVGECAKVITNNKSGILVKPENFMNLHQGLEKLVSLEINPKEMGENLHTVVLKKYSKEVFIKTITNIYLNC
ncbi:glycosyltransferase [Bacteroidota bacterium]